MSLKYHLTQIFQSLRIVILRYLIKNPVTHSFRIRFNRAETDTIQTEASKLVLPSQNPNCSITLTARQDNLSIKDSDQLAIIGSGYKSSTEAELAGERVKAALMLSLARVRVGADFGSRAAKGMFTEHGLKWVEEQIGQRVLNNTHGLMIYETDPKPRFASSNAKMTRGTTQESFISAFTNSLNTCHTLSERDLLSYTLFNASFFQPTADSRFVLLVMAIEALIEPAPRSEKVLAHVNFLISQTKSSEISEIEKKSIDGTLQHLKKESISQAGKRLVRERLGERIYSGKSAANYFNYCYQLRSNLVHGNLPAPTFEEIGTVAGTLEVFVSDLLTSPVLGLPTDQA